MADDGEKILTMLGRRIERLLFFGAVLIGATFMQVFFALASEQFEIERPAQGLEELIKQLQEDQVRLSELYKKKSIPVRPIVKRVKPDTQREKLVADTRKKLGLPPELIEVAPPLPSGPKPETYEERLKDVVNKASIASHSNPDLLTGAIDFTKSPEENLVALRAVVAAAAKKPAQVWGIELPRLLEVQYVGGQYKIPAEFIATALQFVLGPLVLAWLCSIFATRQRELVVITKTDDYKLAYPHVLNYFPVLHYGLTGRFVTRESIEGRIGRWFAIFSNALFRCFVHVVTVVPMVGGFVYAVVKLQVIKTQWSSYAGYFLAPLVLLMAGLGLAIIVQEAIFPGSKEFVNE